jgi:hypothetical protein
MDVRYDSDIQACRQHATISWGVHILEEDKIWNLIFSNISFYPYGSVRHFNSYSPFIFIGKAELESSYGRPAVIYALEEASGTEGKRIHLGLEK